MTEPPSPDKATGWVRLVQTITPANLLTIFGLVVIGVPVYVIWSALHDEKILDRILSVYEEHPDEAGCLIRHVKERGGPDQWGIASAFAVQGIDRWFVSAIISHQPTADEIASYCASAKLLADRLMDRGDLTGPDDRR